LNELDFGGTLLKLFLKSILTVFGSVTFVSVTGSGLMFAAFEFSFLNLGFLRSEPIFGIIAIPPATGDLGSVFKLVFGVKLTGSSSESGS